MRHFKFLFINTLQEFHLEVGDEARHSELANYLNKDLAYADALTTQKWEETERVSVFAAWSQEIRALRVKSIGNEFSRFLPLCGVVVESEDVERNAVTFTQVYIITLTVLHHHDRRRKKYRRLHSKRFAVAV